MSMVLPRPEVKDLLGIAYRRIPLLAIGNDVYCDTSLIASALERKFPKANGFPTLFPSRKGGGTADTGMIKAFAMYYTDRTLFILAAACLPFNELGESFRNDRSDVSSVILRISPF
jgi:glutathione S-transferase